MHSQLFLLSHDFGIMKRETMAYKVTKKEHDVLQILGKEKTYLLFNNHKNRDSTTVSSALKYLKFRERKNILVTQYS